ncbi:MAG: pilin [Clostridia bacterium]|nr:pilin [Clostridia bacterium]
MFDDMVNVVVEVIEDLLPAALTLVTALGMIWCIVLGVKFAKAEEAQDRDKAKAALRNAIIGFVLIFVLIAVLLALEPQLNDWLQSQITSYYSSN